MKEIYKNKNLKNGQDLILKIVKFVQKNNISKYKDVNVKITNNQIILSYKDD